MPPITPPARNRRVLAALALACLMCTSLAIAADTGPSRHAEGAFDASNSSYVVAKGDDLAAIAARFGISVAELKEQNKLDSDLIDVGQILKVAGAPASSGSGSGSASASASGDEPGAAVYTVISGKEGSPAAKASIDGKQLPPPAPPSAVSSRMTRWSPPPGGRRPWCRRRTPRTSC
jgi:LysM repeat protein